MRLGLVPLEGEGVVPGWKDRAPTRRCLAGLFHSNERHPDDIAPGIARTVDFAGFHVARSFDAYNNELIRLFSSDLIMKIPTHHPRHVLRVKLSRRIGERQGPKEKIIHVAAN